MSIEKVSVILRDAKRCRYGVAAFNIFNYETIFWVIKAAEEERMPVIIQFYPGLKKFIPMKVVTSIAKELAAKSDIPIGLHLDHSNSYEDAIYGAHCGFTSIMIDGSTLNFDDNVKLTKQVVSTAHEMDVEVEAELGHVGLGNNLHDFTNSNHFTNPVKAAKFVESTGVDSLAISVGNGHGHYISTPLLDFERIEKIYRCTSVPLVLHGSSDIPNWQLSKAVNYGISKFNIATEYNQSFYNIIKRQIEDHNAEGYMYECLVNAEKEIKEFIKSKIRTLNPNLYRL